MAVRAWNNSLKGIVGCEYRLENVPEIQHVLLVSRWKIGHKLFGSQPIYSANRHKGIGMGPYPQWERDIRLGAIMSILGELSGQSNWLIPIKSSYFLGNG